jgi:hypothetical protein
VLISNKEFQEIIKSVLKVKYGSKIPTSKVTDVLTYTKSKEFSRAVAEELIKYMPEEVSGKSPNFKKTIKASLVSGKLVQPERSDPDMAIILTYASGQDTIKHKVRLGLYSDSVGTFDWAWDSEMSNDLYLSTFKEGVAKDFENERTLTLSVDNSISKKKIESLLAKAGIKNPPKVYVQWQIYFDSIAERASAQSRLIKIGNSEGYDVSNDRFVRNGLKIGI